jgi:hypothetical protein
MGLNWAGWLHFLSQNQIESQLNDSQLLSHSKTASVPLFTDNNFAFIYIIEKL